MRSYRRLMVIGVFTLLIMALSLQPALGKNRGTGTIVDSYRADSGKAAPAWVTTAIEQGLSRLGARYSRADLAVVGADRDDLGMQHVRYDQRYQGLPVFGGQVIAHMDTAGALLSESGTFYQGISLDPRPAISDADAISVAQRELAYPGRFLEQPTAKLLVLPKDDGSYVLAYQVTIKIEDGTEATAHHQYFINARDGSVAWYYNSLAYEELGRPHFTDAVGSGRSLYSGTVSIHTDLVSGVYNLRDLTRGSMITTDMNGGTSGSGSIFTDSDNVWGTGTTSSRQSAAVDAHFGAAQTWDYYLNVHGRRGINGSGFRMVSRVHYGNRFNNAFWNGSSMTYGDGDGTTFRPLVALDVAGHEITHGVTERTAGLIYSNESGAANESFSDIFGTAVEFFSDAIVGPRGDYLIGEDIYTPNVSGDALRNMANPQAEGDPDHYSRRFTGSTDNGGVHTNSGIQNNAFYLLAQGGTNRTSGLSVTGIGRAKAERIFYRALTVYLTPSSNFRSVRTACINAARDLFGASSAEATATAAAWTAVGVN